MTDTNRQIYTLLQGRKGKKLITLCCKTKLYPEKMCEIPDDNHTGGITILMRHCVCRFLVLFIDSV